jgi:uncharacterized YccA/Bax inhibitor family protein
MRSGNPVLGSTTFTGLPRIGVQAMTLQGTVNKTAVLLICVFATSVWTWNQARAGHNVWPEPLL